MTSVRSPVLALTNVSELDGSRHLPDRWLSESEQARFRRFRAKESANQYLVGRILLKSIVGSLLSKDIAEVVVSVGPLGAPLLLNTNINCSISHSDGVVAVAIAYDSPVGVDIEMFDKGMVVEDVLAVSLRPAEKADVMKSPIPEHRFLSYWTAKEAALKAAGVGFVIDPVDVEVNLVDRPSDVRIPVHEHALFKTANVVLGDLTSGHRIAWAQQKHLLGIENIEARWCSLPNSPQEAAKVFTGTHTEKPFLANPVI